MLTGQHAGAFGTVLKIKSKTEYEQCSVGLADGTKIAWVGVQSSGLTTAKYEAEFGDAVRKINIRETRTGTARGRHEQRAHERLQGVSEEVEVTQ